MFSQSSDSGVTGALPYDPVEYCILAACTAIAWAFTIELNVVAVITFRRWKGLYFWSLLICSWGCTLHALGFILKFLVGTSWLVDLAFIEIGWIAMVSGQSFVLYSRLNLVVRNKAILRGVLTAIIIDGFALHTPTLVFIYGANSPSATRWVEKFNLMERIQLTGFCIQESVISSIYIVAIVRILAAVYYLRTRRAMLQLLAINFLCIGMDMILIGLEFSNYYVAEASVKPLIYAIKLKLEFAVYRQLVGFTKATFDEQADGDSLSRVINSPGDIFKAIPNALRKPSVSSTPTITTHPELLLRTKRIDITSMWDSSQIELSPSTIAAALTASGGRGGTAAPRKARNLMGNPPDDSKPRVARRARLFDWGRSRNVDCDQRSDPSEADCYTGVGVMQSHEP